MALDTPIVLIIFNRPDLTEKVFKEIRKLRPKRLLVIADGCRPDKQGEKEMCEASRALIDASVDWECEVLKNYSDVNLGSGRRIASGLDWAFSMVEEAIILEDDCLPHPSFFSFCQGLLKRYKDDERIMMISGTNYFGSWIPNNQSYHFSHFAGNWGCATWRRAWRYFDFDFEGLSQAIDANFTRNIFQENGHCLYWEELFQESQKDKDHFNAWDYQWLFARWIQNGLGIVPNRNLISNLGFRLDATNTTDEESPLNALTIEAMQFPLVHPPFIVRDWQLDQMTQQTFFGTYKSKNRIVSIARSIYGKIRTGFCMCI